MMAHHSHKKAAKQTSRAGRTTVVLRIVLLVFVLTAVVALVVREVRGKRAQTPDPSTIISTPSSPSSSVPGTTPATVDTSVPANGVMAYYLHTTARCSSCITIETWTAEAIRKTFAAALADGTLVWRVLDVEEPANTHFIEDYELVSKSVVLVRYTNGKPGKWENLQDVWQLLGDQKAFQDYITSSTRSFLDSKE
jgi:hypothetical protein